MSYVPVRKIPRSYAPSAEMVMYGVGADVVPVALPPRCEPDRWNMPPYAVHNGLIAGLVLKGMGISNFSSAVIGIGAWYFFSGKWWR